MRSERSIPLASPPCSVLTSSDVSVSRESPLSSIVSGCSGASTSAVSGACAVAMVIRESLLLAYVVAYGSEHLHELDSRRSNRDDPNRREDAHHKREHHLHACLSRGFFGALPALGPKRVREHAQGVGDAGAEFICLNQHGDERRQIVNARAI